MQSLAIVVCGQLRTFFEPDVQASFRAFLERCASKYYVVVFFVLNEPVDGIDTTRVHATTAAAAAARIDSVAAEMPAWLAAFGTQIASSPVTPVLAERCAAIPQILLEVKDPLHFLTKNTPPYAFLQFKQGLQKIREYEGAHRIAFDFVMRTRPDMLYPADLLPFSNAGHPLFPHSVLQQRLYERRCAFSGVDSRGYHMDALLPKDYRELRIPDALFGMNLGGAYYCRRSASATAPHLYSWNDHVIFGPREHMMKFERFFEMFSNPALLTVAEERRIQFLVAQEALLLLFAFLEGMDMYMYLDDSWSLRRPGGGR